MFPSDIHVHITSIISMYFITIIFLVLLCMGKWENICGLTGYTMYNNPIDNLLLARHKIAVISCSGIQLSLLLANNQGMSKTGSSLFFHTCFLPFFLLYLLCLR